MKRNLYDRNKISIHRKVQAYSFVLPELCWRGQSFNYISIETGWWMFKEPNQILESQSLHTMGTGFIDLIIYYGRNTANIQPPLKCTRWVCLQTRIGRRNLHGVTKVTEVNLFGKLRRGWRERNCMTAVSDWVTMHDTISGYWWSSNEAAFT